MQNADINANAKEIGMGEDSLLQRQAVKEENVIADEDLSYKLTIRRSFSPCTIDRKAESI